MGGLTREGALYCPMGYTAMRSSTVMWQWWTIAVGDAAHSQSRGVAESWQWQSGFRERPAHRICHTYHH